MISHQMYNTDHTPYCWLKKKKEPSFQNVPEIKNPWPENIEDANCGEDQALFPSKDKSKKNKVSSVTIFVWRFKG